MDLKLKENNFNNSADILTKNIRVLEKNCKIEQEVEGQKLKNEIDSLKRKLETTESRLESKIKESKQKDSFIQNTIIGRSKQEDVSLILAELERIFLTCEKQQLARGH